ncbi:uncharacterized protein LOC100186769 [Ciona intestinalis]
MQKFLEEESRIQGTVTSQKDGSHTPDTPPSDEEQFRLPDGSPTFTSVMHELHIRLTDMELEEPKTPISPLALNSESSNGEKNEPSSPKFLLSPNAPRKRITSASTTASCGRSRSMSWNARNKLAAERRKAMMKPPPRSDSHPTSPCSSPLNNRKAMRSRTQPNTPKLAHIFPKYRFPNEVISVSHDDLVREQERERRLADDFHEAKSIFDTAVYSRFGVSPE